MCAVKPSQSTATTDQSDCEKNPRLELAAELAKLNAKQKENEENYQTPVSFKMNKFMMCFKSEPDLSRVQDASSEDRSKLNRGRFIAKKLLGGVSMINLRQPLAASNDRVNTINIHTTANDLKVRIRTSCFVYRLDTI